MAKSDNEKNITGMRVVYTGKVACSVGMVLLLTVGVPQISWAQESGKESFLDRSPGFRVEMELEYLFPVDKDRQIETTSLNIFLETSKKVAGKRWTFYKGVTLTRPWGTIKRTTIDPDSSAFGLGPVVLWRNELWQRDPLKLSFDSSVGLIFYNTDFPAGGDFYNFMWRFGPKLTYQFNPKNTWSIGYKFMHVSNGQISRRQPTHNPAYNAGGFFVGLSRRF